MSNRTFSIIKPNAVAAGNTGKILDMMIGAGFRIIAMKMMFLSRNQAEKFYSAHASKPFFGELADFMISGSLIVMVLEKDDAVAELRRLVGATDPAKADEGTIRRIFGESLSKNSVHASDSDESARTEAAQFFSDDEIIIARYINIEDK